MTQPLPKAEINQLSADLFKDFSTSGCVLAVVADILPKVNKLLEENMIAISESFSEMATIAREVEKDPAASEEIKEKVGQISSNITKAIVGLQFQDRVSQNLVIAENISKFLNARLENNLHASKALFDEKVDVNLCKDLLEKITLGEIRNVFIAYLIEQGLIENSDKLCYTMHEQEDSEEIELF